MDITDEANELHKEYRKEHPIKHKPFKPIRPRQPEPRELKPKA